MSKVVEIAEIGIKPCVSERECEGFRRAQQRASPEWAAGGWTVCRVVGIPQRCDGRVRPGDAIPSIDRGGNRLETEIDDPHQSVRSERARNKSSDRKKNGQKKQFS